jgi:hypothetical protein
VTIPPNAATIFLSLLFVRCLFVLREAMAKVFKDPGFLKEFKKLTGVDASPIPAEAIESAVREIPRDPETIGLYKHLADHRPMPPR